MTVRVEGNKLIITDNHGDNFELRMGRTGRAVIHPNEDGEIVYLDCEDARELSRWLAAYAETGIVGPPADPPPVTAPGVQDDIRDRLDEMEDSLNKHASLLYEMSAKLLAVQSQADGTRARLKAAFGDCD